MNTTQAEKLLSVLYSASAVFSLLAIVSFAVPWDNWRWTLDECLNIDCGCILYGMIISDNFIGGDIKVCAFAVYALVPVLIIGISYAVYHCYRSCIDSAVDPTVDSSQRIYYNRNRDGVERVVITPKQRPPFNKWIASAFLAIIICCLCLSHAIIVTDGYYKTCEQYKKNVVKLVNAPSRVAETIFNRLDCGAIYDYMDYLQLDSNKWYHRERINTKISLHLTIVSSWFNVIIWFTILVLNFTMGKRSINNAGNSIFCCCN